MQADLPENILFLDYESKSLGLHEALGFGQYFDIPAEVAKQARDKDWRGRDVWQCTKKIVTDLPTNKFTVCVVDTVGDLEEALGDEITGNPTAYGVKPNQTGGGYGGIYPAVSRQVNNFIARLNAKGVRAVIALAHTKPQWSTGGPVPNKLRAHGCNEWHDKSKLELVLVPGQGTIPAGLVQKESLAGLYIDKDKGGFKAIRRLPLRLPEATWTAINNYLDEPANLTSPKEGEVPTDEERQPYSDYYSREQLEFLIRGASIIEGQDKA